MERDPVVSLCLCGARYALSEYRDLRYVGIAWHPAEYRVEGAEVRRCACGRLLALAINRDGTYQAAQAVGEP